MQCTLQNGKTSHRNLLSHFLLYCTHNCCRISDFVWFFGKRTFWRYFSTVMSYFLLYCPRSLLQDIRHRLILLKAPILTLFFKFDKFHWHCMCLASYRQCVYAIKWKRSKSRLASRVHLKLCTPAMQCKLQNGKKQHRNVLSHFLLYSPWSLLQDIRHCVILGKQTLSRYLSTVMSPFLLYCTISLLQDIRHHLILWKAPILTPFYNCN